MFAPEVLDIISDTNAFEVAAFVENQDRSRVGEQINGVPVVWIDDIINTPDRYQAICSLGTTQRRGYIETIKAAGVPFATVIHPTARISSTSTLGDGCFVSAGTIVAAQTHIGSHVILNRGVLVGHDTVISDYVTVSPGANIAGAITIGTGSYIGMGATIIDRLSIGDGALIGAASLVTKDVPAHTQAMGAPARVVKENIEPR